MQMRAKLQREGSFSFVTTWWRNWKRRRAAVGELTRCGQDEVAHLARDVGVSPAELHTLAGRWPDTENLLPRRLAALGLGAEQIAHSNPQVLRDLQRVCGQCASQSHCAHDLDTNDRDRAWRSYCPNVATLDALGARRTAARCR
jgi:uncharacterized protein YjiS (DUF1127 family)